MPVFRSDYLFAAGINHQKIKLQKISKVASDVRMNMKDTVPEMKGIGTIWPRLSAVELLQPKEWFTC